MANSKPAFNGGAGREFQPEPESSSARSLVQLWLGFAGFAEHAAALTGLDGAALAAATNEDLRARGVSSWGHRQRILKAVGGAAFPWSSALAGGGPGSHAHAFVTAAHRRRGAAAAV